MALSKPTARKGISRRQSRYAPMSEINVTPMVDVMLVLLVIFMVAAPLLTVGVPVDLPETQAAPLNEEVEPVAISMDSSGQIFIQDTAIEFSELVPRLRAITSNKPDTRIYVRGDSSLEYGEVMQLMGQITAAGFSKVALVTEMPGRSRR